MFKRRRLVAGSPSTGSPAGLLTPEALALAQGAFFVVSGLWPIVHLRSFEAITGPKVDGWLVKTVGALIVTVGVPLVRAGRAGKVDGNLVLAAAGSAASLAAIDLVYVPKGRISPIYLLDAVTELAIVAAWVAAWRNEEQRAMSDE